MTGVPRRKEEEDRCARGGRQKRRTSAFRVEGRIGGRKRRRTSTPQKWKGQVWFAGEEEEDASGIRKEEEDIYASGGQKGKAG